jgi:hypothetical protein
MKHHSKVDCLKGIIYMRDSFKKLKEQCKSKSEYWKERNVMSDYNYYHGLYVGYMLAEESLTSQMELYYSEFMNKGETQ